MRFSSWVIFGVLGLAAQAKSPFLLKLESIQDRFATFQDFDSDPHAKEIFCDTWVQYGGSNRIAKEACLKIIELTRKVIAVKPELAPRIWRKAPTVESFELPLPESRFGRSLQPDAWREYWKGLLQAMGVWAEKFAAIAHDPERVRTLLATDVTSDRKRWGYVFDGLLGEQGTLGELEGAMRSMQAHFLLHALLSHEATRDLFESGDAELILTKFEEIERNPDSLAWDEHVPSHLRKLFARGLPPFRHLMKQDRLFTRDTHALIKKGGALEVHTVSPFLSAFAGMWVGECIGGGKDYIAQTSYERFLSRALAGAQTHFFELKTSGATYADHPYRSFSEFIPGTLDGKRGYCTNFGAPILKQYVKVDGKKKPLLHHYVEKMRQRKLGVFPLWMSNSSSAGNSGVEEFVQGSSSYLFGAVVGKAARLYPEDPDYKEWVGLLPRTGSAASYAKSGRMVFTGTSSTSEMITELTLDGFVVDEAELGQALVKKLAVVSDEYELNKYRRFWERTFSLRTPEVNEAIRSRLRDSKGIVFLIFSEMWYSDRRSAEREREFIQRQLRSLLGDTHDEGMQNRILALLFDIEAMEAGQMLQLASIAGPFARLQLARRILAGESTSKPTSEHVRLAQSQVDALAGDREPRVRVLASLDHVTAMMKLPRQPFSMSLDINHLPTSMPGPTPADQNHFIEGREKDFVSWVDCFFSALSEISDEGANENFARLVAEMLDGFMTTVYHRRDTSELFLSRLDLFRERAIDAIRRQAVPNTDILAELQGVILMDREDVQGIEGLFNRYRESEKSYVKAYALMEYGKEAGISSIERLARFKKMLEHFVSNPGVLSTWPQVIGKHLYSDLDAEMANALLEIIEDKDVDDQLAYSLAWWIFDDKPSREIRDRVFAIAERNTHHTGAMLLNFLIDEPLTTEELERALCLTVGKLTGAIEELKRDSDRLSAAAFYQPLNKTAMVLEKLMEKIEIPPTARNAAAVAFALPEIEHHVADTSTLKSYRWLERYATERPGPHPHLASHLMRKRTFNEPATARTTVEGLCALLLASRGGS